MDRTLGLAWIGLSAHDPQSDEHAEYIPGVCNIGPAEIAKRRRAGWSGAVATAAIWAVLALIDAPPAVRLVTFFPAAMAAAGFLQAWMHFCAYFGFASLLNFGPEAGKTGTVVEAEFRRKDRIKARQILGYAILIGLAVASAAYLA